MEDREIVKLFFRRSEVAISECEKKYGRYLTAIANRILGDDEDAKETVNDIYLCAWNNMPPKKPDDLGAYLGMICRSRAIDKRKSETREKRGGDGYDASLDELVECLPCEDENVVDGIALRDAMNAFLGELPKKSRVVFMKRYFWFLSVSEIAQSLGMGESAVKMTLSRVREKLKEYLMKEGFTL